LPSGGILGAVAGRSSAFLLECPFLMCRRQLGPTWRAWSCSTRPTRPCTIWLGLTLRRSTR